MAVNQQTVAQALQQAGVSVFNLKVEDAGGVVALRGDVATQADKDAVQRIVQGLGTAAANYITVQGVAGGVTTDSAVRRYVVKSGDTLSKIAKREYGDASEWKKIHEANRAKIPNPDLIHPGDELVIP
jgi:nucleoid-associated protein YgaU